MLKFAGAPGDIAPHLIVGTTTWASLCNRAVARPLENLLVRADHSTALAAWSESSQWWLTITDYDGSAFASEPSAAKPRELPLPRVSMPLQQLAPAPQSAPENAHRKALSAHEHLWQTSVLEPASGRIRPLWFKTTFFPSTGEIVGVVASETGEVRNDYEILSRRTQSDGTVAAHLRLGATILDDLTEPEWAQRALDIADGKLADFPT